MYFGLYKCCLAFVLCRWVLLEVLDKISQGLVNWKQATKPPIKMPFRKVENCNQVISIGKELNFSLVNVAGSDIVQGNKKLILGNKLPKVHTKSCFCMLVSVLLLLFCYSVAFIFELLWTFFS